MPSLATRPTGGPTDGIVRLGSGHPVRVRPQRRDDRDKLAAAVEEMSATSRHRRFHTGLPRLSGPMLDHLSAVDHHDHDAVVALEPGSGELAGVARFIRDPDHRDHAELAITVIDRWQHRGLGTLLLRHLADRARRAGIVRFTAQILAENVPTLALIRSLGPAELTPGGATVQLVADMRRWPAPAEDRAAPTGWPPRHGRRSSRSPAAPTSPADP